MSFPSPVRGEGLTFASSLYALRLTARQRAALLPQVEIAQSHILGPAAARGEWRDVRQKRHRCVDAHRQHVADAPVLEAHRLRLRVEAPSAADVAHHAHVRQEAHLDLLKALAFAGLAAAAGGIE